MCFREYIILQNIRGGGGGGGGGGGTPFQDAESATKVASNLEKGSVKESQQQTGAESGVELQLRGAEDTDDT